MLDDIRDVDVIPRDPRLLEPAVEQPPRRTDERMTLDVLPIARLLADEHHLGLADALAHDGLRRALPQLAGAAILDLALRL